MLYTEIVYFGRDSVLFATLQAGLFSLYTCQMGKGTVVQMPGGAPKIGDVYKHYKGDLYKVVGIALNSSSDEDEWLVVYEPNYENPAAPLFVRPLSEWNTMVEWEGKQIARFTKQ